MKIKLFLLAILTVLLFPVAALAETATFTIRLGQPKTPTNQNNIRLTYVALDTRTDRQITVQCFKQGPSDGGFSQFGLDTQLIAGGNTDYCDVTNAILTTEGTYKFMVRATNNADGEYHTSDIVTVEYNTSGPSTPVSYSKERINSCDYKIKFRTANDGKTTKVQLFRSDTLSISIDSGSAIATLSIGPDQEGSIVNSVPDCSKDYYYVIRAADSADNVSGTIGDSFTTTTTTTTTGTTPGAGTSGTSGAIALSGASTQVTSDETTSTPSGTTGDGSSVTGTPSPEILGATTDGKWTFKKWIVLLVIGFVIYFVLNFVKRLKSK